MNPDIRLVSDAERNYVVSRLRQACVDGRLGVEEFSRRVDAALAARTAGQLAAAADDVPALRCSSCGVEVGSSSSFCPNCGNRLRPEARAMRASPPAPLYAAAVSTVTPKDAGLAFVLEVLAGLFGFLGIGHMYSGQVGRGVTLLLVLWAYTAFEVVFVFVTFGFGLCFLPAMGLVHLGAPIVSALWLKRDMDARALAAGAGRLA
jgi:TM2 domain-containing membrane protein YozV